MSVNTDADIQESLSRAQKRISSVSTTVDDLVKERDQHEQYHRVCARFQYAFVLMVAIGYLVYGTTRYSQSMAYHRVNSYITNTDTSYPVPVTMVCQNVLRSNVSQFESLVNITQIIVDKTPMSFKPTFKPDIDFVDDPAHILNLSRWNALEFVINKTFPFHFSPQNRSIEFNVTLLFQCQILVPPKDATFRFGYLQTYLYYKSGLGEISQTLGRFDANYKIPHFMTAQFQYKVIHRIFHFEALLNSVRNRFPDATADRLNLSQVSLAAFSYGTTVYASPWSITDFVLSLITHKYVENEVVPLFGTKYKTVDAFDVETVSSLSEIFAPDLEPIAPNWTLKEDMSVVNFNHFPHEQNSRLKVDCNITHPRECEATNNFYHRYDEEYLEYTIWDLLSGLGGIVTGSYSLFAMIIKFALFGCWKWDGLAPYPPLGKTFEKQLRTFQKIDNMEHAIEGYSQRRSDRALSHRAAGASLLGQED